VKYLKIGYFSLVYPQAILKLFYLYII